MIKRSVIIHHLEVLVAAIAVGRVSCRDDAARHALLLWEIMLFDTCVNPESPTQKECDDLFRAVLRKALELAEVGTE